jgi:hypothetical protein
MVLLMPSEKEIRTLDVVNAATGEDVSIPGLELQLVTTAYLVCVALLLKTAREITELDAEARRTEVAPVGIVRLIDSLREAVKALDDVERQQWQERYSNVGPVLGH